MSTPDRRSGDDECGLRGERGSSTGLRGRKADTLDSDPHDLIRYPRRKSSRRLVRAPAGRRGPSPGRTGVVLARGRGPTSGGERLPSPWWDEVTVNRSGGTTIESAGPRQRARRRATRQGRLGVTGACTAGVTRPATELSFVRWHGPTGRAPPRRWLPVGQEGHEGGEVRVLGSANDVVVARHRCLIYSSWSRAEHAAHNMSIAVTAGRADRVAIGPRRACTRPVATTNRGQSRRAAAAATVSEPASSWTCSLRVSPAELPRSVLPFGRAHMRRPTGLDRLQPDVSRQTVATRQARRVSRANFSPSSRPAGQPGRRGLSDRFGVEMNARIGGDEDIC